MAILNSQMVKQYGDLLYISLPEGILRINLMAKSSSQHVTLMLSQLFHVKGQKPLIGLRENLQKIP